MLDTLYLYMAAVDPAATTISDQKTRIQRCIGKTTQSMLQVWTKVCGLLGLRCVACVVVGAMFRVWCANTTAFSHFARLVPPPPKKKPLLL